MNTGIVEKAVTRLTMPRTHNSRPPGVFERTFSAVGLVTGLYFFSMSLTPSLLPRAGVVQGVNSGVAFMIGYGVGVGVYALWRFLNIPAAKGRPRMIILVVALGIVALIWARAIWQYVGWQNEVRLTFGMDPLSPVVWPVIAISAFLTAALVLVVARSIRKLFRVAGNLLDRWLPRRLAITVAATILVVVLWWVLSGAFVTAFFAGANALFSARDGWDKPGVEQSFAWEKSGSPESLVDYETIGREGRAFLWRGPSAEDINEFTGGGALEPIRAYVGLKHADTLQERADLLLEELLRTDAFSREILVVATTTGTGYLDPAGVDPLEYLYNGDTAIAGVQYSYLPSWISILADQEVVQETSRVVFRTIHEYWSTLPEDERPELYLYGLSLGSYGVEAILTSVEIVNEPIDGAVMTGPTFVNPMHYEVTDNRDEGSAPWQPVVNDGKTVRFTAEEYGLDQGTAPWGPTRVVYLQHGSDPIVFFSPTLAFDEPEWLEDGQRAPDVVESMTWIPIVTMWQVLLDMPAAGTIPDGYGHLYSVRANLDSWVGATGAPLTTAEVAALGDHLTEREARLEAEWDAIASE